MSYRLHLGHPWFLAARSSRSEVSLCPCGPFPSFRDPQDETCTNSSKFSAPRPYNQPPTLRGRRPGSREVHGRKLKGGLLSTYRLPSAIDFAPHERCKLFCRIRAWYIIHLRNCISINFSVGTLAQNCSWNDSIFQNVFRETPQTSLWHLGSPYDFPVKKRNK